LQSLCIYVFLLRVICRYLARPAAESRHGELYVLLLFLIHLFILFLTIPVRPIISKSTGPIFTKFSRLIELWLRVINLKFVFRSLKGIAVATNLYGWLGSRVVSVLDSGAERPAFKSQSRRCWVTVLGKLFTPIVPLFTKQQNR